MATRLSVISTRTGDAGITGLGDGQRVPKDDARVAAMGDVDELNSVIGLWRCETLPADVDALLGRIQHDLFDLGAELCIPGHSALHEKHVLSLDEALAHYNASLGKLQEFILPGGCRAAALAHIARTVCRRAERSVIGLHRGLLGQNHNANCGDDHTEDAGSPAQTRGTVQTQQRESTPTDQQGINAPVRQYLNRLSDLCFVLARHLNRESGCGDVLWQRT
jgi:cob(I)alamin adenosyltransferase